MQSRFITRIHDCPAEQWDRLCPTDYPFIRHGFLAALEDSGSAAPAKGWQAYHLLIETEGELIAALPGYLKYHSYGEYVFDWAWAEAYHRHGLNYYPKWINAIPFTPCQGPRLLMAPGVSLRELIPHIVHALNSVCLTQGLSGWHCLFPDETLSKHLHTHQALQRLGCQFHWFNRGYHSVDDFLAALQSRKRKNILKERRQIQAQGFDFVVKEGAAITPDDWSLFYRLYRNTYQKRSGHEGYLNVEFFQQIGAKLSEHLVMIQARKTGEQADEGAIVAAALFLRDSNCLYGRYWGCLEEYPFLHFETCYYQGIDYAINQGLQRFDGGAQGEHKIARGFDPVLTLSNHWIQEPAFREAIDGFLTTEAAGIHQYLAEARCLSPYKTETP